MENIYYHPEDHGLKIFAMVEQPDMSYSFSMLVVWQGPRGGLYYASDSGCSCPCPFEDYYTVDALEPIHGESGLEAFYRALSYWRECNYNTDTSYLRRKVREYMTARGKQD